MTWTAAVTGDAGGLGSAFARGLSARGYDLFLTDRDADGLDRLASELSGHVDTAVADLACDADAERVAERLAAMAPALLVNNAGFGTHTLFHEADLARQVDMVAVHVVATMRLCRAVLPGMIARHRGAIINVASAGAFMRFPRDATYIGTKAFLVAFTECLAIELAGTGVKVQALCPGWLRTGSGTGDYQTPVPGFLFASPEQTASSSLRALGRGRTRHVPTLRTRAAISLLGSRPGLAGLAWIRHRRSN